jgi:hypothetical protein
LSPAPVRRAGYPRPIAYAPGWERLLFWSWLGCALAGLLDWILGVSASFVAAAERAFSTHSCPATARVLTFDATLAAELKPGQAHPSAKVAGATITFEFRRLHGAPTPVVMSRAAPGHWLVDRVGSLG